MSWDIMSQMAPHVQRFVHGEEGCPKIHDGEICILVSGKKLIEASSKPTRTYVGFDRGVHGEMIRACNAMPERERYFFIDREYHLFDADYLHGRQAPLRIQEAETLSYGSYGTGKAKEGGTKVVALNVRPREGDLSAGAPAQANTEKKQLISSEQEDMFETLADA